MQSAQFLVQRRRFGGREHRRLIDDGFFAEGEFVRRNGLRSPRQKGEQEEPAFHGKLTCGGALMAASFSTWKLALALMPMLLAMSEAGKVRRRLL